MIKFFRHIRYVIPTVAEESLVKVVEISQQARNDNTKKL